MTIRQMEFNTGEETAIQPTVVDPSTPTDIVTKGFADQNYMQGGEAVADVAALKAVAAENRKDKDVRLIDSTNEFYKFDSSSSETGDDVNIIVPTSGTGRWILISATGSGGSGGINYLNESDSSNAESVIGDWVTYADAAATTPVNGIDGTADITFTRNTTTPLRGNGDFQLAVDAANRQGQGASVDFVVDRADRNKVLGIRMDVDATDANYVDDDLQVFIYDVDTSTLITPYSPANGYKIKGNKYQLRVAFSPSDTSSSNYRLIIHVASTNSTGYSVYFDNFEVGPGQVQAGFDGIWKPYSQANGDFTITGTNWTTQYSKFVPQKLADGKWRLFFNFRGLLSSAASNITLTFSGTAFETSGEQSFTVRAQQVGTADRVTLFGRVSNAASGIVQLAASGGSADLWVVSGFADLDSKPTYADFDPIATFYPTTEDLAFTTTESFTPTGSWTTNTTYTGTKSRMFDSLRMSIRLTLSGAPNATTLTVNLPDGLTAFTNGTNKKVGDVFLYDVSTTANRQTGQISVANGGTTLNFTGAPGSAVNATAPFTWASGDIVDIDVLVPITQWQNPGALSPIGLELASQTNYGLSLIPKYIVKQSNASLTNGTVADIGSGTIDLNPGKYLVEFGARSRVSDAVGLTSIAAELHVTDSADSIISSEEISGLSLYSSGEYRTSIIGMFEYIPTSNVTLKLRGECTTVGGGTTTRRIDDGFLKVTRISN
jgi:hypothetical protein